MNEEKPDFDLLQAFARQADQAAFAALVRRHLDLVYATAFRKVKDQGGAEDVAQLVFGVLVKKAWQFAPDDSLPAWLYKTALLQSKNWLRGEIRRRQREQTAAELGTIMKTDEQPALGALIPLLDEALLSLREKDRAALLLRFYENRSLRDVGALLGVSEDTAQKRVASAVDKVSKFFHRRGFKTATISATTAALQQTATSAPISLAGSIIGATANLAPPATMGFLLRLASLTKVQTVSVCLGLATVPIVWQWTRLNDANSQASQFETRLSERETNLISVRTEIDRLDATSGTVIKSMETEANAAKRRADATKAFAAFKGHLSTLLMDPNYRWPSDSPFVRIPKSALRSIQVENSVSPPGVLSQSARELLGLTPDERTKIEAMLHDHFSTMDELMQSHITETNQPRCFSIPPEAVASQVWTVPALGDTVQTMATKLESNLKNVLGEERWPFVQSELENNGMNTLREILSLDAGKDPVEIGVWLEDRNGQLTVSYGVSSGYSTMTSSGMGLSLFASDSPSSETLSALIRQPPALTQKIQAWLYQQATAHATPGNVQ